MNWYVWNYLLDLPLLHDIDSVLLRYKGTGALTNDMYIFILWMFEIAASVYCKLFWQKLEILHIHFLSDKLFANIYISGPKKKKSVKVWSWKNVYIAQI